MDSGNAAAEEIIRLLGLRPLEPEGGFYAETYRSPEALPAEMGGVRCLATAILYLLEEGRHSRMHRLASDEIFHHYLGDPVEMLLLHPDGTGRTCLLGKDLLSGQRQQFLVPRGIWQGARVVPGGTFALLGTTVSPGFDPADYEHGDCDLLSEKYPAFRSLIRLLSESGDSEPR